jgi:hypothetical protein
MVTLAFCFQINPLYSLQPPLFFEASNKKIATKKSPRAKCKVQKLKKNEFHFNNSCYVQPKKKKKKNLILATTYKSHDNSNLMKYKNTATIIVK